MPKSENEHGPKVLDFQRNNMLNSLGKGNTYLAQILNS